MVLMKVKRRHSSFVLFYILTIFSNKCHGLVVANFIPIIVTIADYELIFLGGF